MSDKELMYIEDALSQLKLFQTKCETYSNQMQDRELKAYLKEVEARCRTMFNKIYKVLQ